MTYIDVAVPIAAHANTTTNIHGTGAGNVIVGDDELTGFAGSKTGSYTGNDATDRGIAHGCGTTPQYIVITSQAEGRLFIMVQKNMITSFYASTISTYNPSAPDNTNFYVGETDMTKSANANAVGYNWYAFY